MDMGLKFIIIAIMGTVVYREILKSAASPHASPPKEKASFLTLVTIGGAVGLLVTFGMSITRIETRDLRPLHPSTIVSIYDHGVIHLNGMVIQTHLAPQGELASLAIRLTQGCQGDDGCQAQKLFDYVTHIPYKTDYTSRSPKEVIATNWGDCDDKTNLFASLLTEVGVEYRLVYVPHHVFVVVHVDNTHDLPFLRAKVRIEGRDYYYAETTATGAKIGDFNGQFPYHFEGMYDLKNHKAIDLKGVSFGEFGV